MQPQILDSLPESAQQRQRRERAEHFDKIAKAARRNPGKWVLVDTALHSISPRQIRLGLSPSFRPAGRYDARMRDGQLWLCCLAK